MLNFQHDISNLSEKDTVLLRVDFNLSRKRDGSYILNDRFYSVIPVIKKIVGKGCALILVSHMGRPKPGVVTDDLSLLGLVPHLSNLLGQSVHFLSKWPMQKTYLSPGSVALAENTRFLLGEVDNSPALVKKMLQNITVVIMEAFACSHRKHASTVGIVEHAKLSILGPCHTGEINAMDKFTSRKGTSAALVGGKKLATKLSLLEQLLSKMDFLCLGGGLANTILYGKGYNLGTSWIEYSQLRASQALCQLSQVNSVELLLPVDVVVCENLDSPESVRTVDIENIAPYEMVIDIGEKTIKKYAEKIAKSESVYWNGPMGIYEHALGIEATKCLAKNIVNSDSYSLVGGGDTLSALSSLGIEGFSHASTGGGAFLHYLAHGTSPVLSILKERREYVCVEQRS